jgi:GrpB-like predicted nucleotidyltransferase (UPF0157 family)
VTIRDSRTDGWDILGTDGTHVEVVPYREAWAQLFAREAERIIESCGGAAVRVEHIGSTAVPGLSAKPILDLMPGLSHLDDGKRTVIPMRKLGYEYRGEHGIPGRLYFEKYHRGRRAAHVHMFEIGSPEWNRHLAFRDHLRTHPDDLRAYEGLKRELAIRHRDDRKAYTDAKAPFIQEILSRRRSDAAGPWDSAGAVGAASNMDRASDAVNPSRKSDLSGP